MRVVVLFSGGKDSTYAVWWALSQGFEIVSLLSAVPREEGSLMFHHPNAALTEKLAEAMELPWKSFETGKKGSDASEEEELSMLKGALAGFVGKADAVVSGALASDYQKNRIDRICEELCLVSYSPLWHKDQSEYMRELVFSGFEIVCVGVFAQGLGEKWLGKPIDESALSELESIREKFKVSVAGEGGEWESLVVNSPLHKKRLEIVSAEKKWEGNSGTYIVLESRLAEK